MIAIIGRFEFDAEVIADDIEIEHSNRCRSQMKFPVLQNSLILKNIFSVTV
jgi:hypothetical protein